MIGKKARRKFLGEDGERLGCAQAVAAAFLEMGPVEGIRVEAFAKATGGKAPQGYCGALYAALTIAEKTAPRKAQELKCFFTANAGGLTCKEIRAKKKLKCADCVERAAEILAETTPTE